MRVRSLAFLVTSLALSAPSLGCTIACPQCAGANAPPAPRAAEASTHPPEPPKSRHVFRLELVVTTTDPGKAPSPSTFIVSAEENGHADVHVGSNIPLGASNVRQDVGLKLHCQIMMSGDDLLLHTNLEMSSADEPTPAAIHKVTAGSDTLVTPGTMTQVMSVEEPLSHRRYQVTATATKVR